jgi:4-hydroxybenzoate polyprenyltransferase
MIRDIVKLIRLPHWLKNLFVFAPLVFSFHLLEVTFLRDAVLAFFAFCFISSFSYIINDMADRRLDRRHPEKKLRPLARGSVSFLQASVSALVLLAVSAGASAAVNPKVAAVIMSFAVWNVLYTFCLKRMVILDVFAVAAGFLLRIVGGAAAIRVPLSHWMLLVTFFLSLFLGFSKRRAELLDSESNTESRKVLSEYSTSLLDSLIGISAALAIVTYSLYVTDKQTIARLSNPYLVYTVPFVIFGLFRYLYLIQRRKAGSDVVEALVKDVPILIDVCLWTALTLMILYCGCF